MATLSPRMAAACRKSLETVSQPAGIALMVESSPTLSPLPPACSAHACVADSKIELLDVLVSFEPTGRAFEHDAPAFEHIAEVSQIERHLRVLLDQQHRRGAEGNEDVK